MSVRLRPFLAAGAIAVAILFARNWLNPSFRTEAVSPATATSPFASAARTPAIPAPSSPEPSVEDAACTELFRSGRFADLLRVAADLDNEEERTRWLDACARSAPPRLLAEQALRLPRGPWRDSLLQTAIARWALDAPVDLAEWATANLENDRSLDFALTHLVEHTDSIHRPTSTVLTWVRLIHDPALHFRALRAVVREWAGTDPDAALRFAETVPDLAADQRAELLTLFVPPVPET